LSNRYLQGSYWNCPIIDYSSFTSNDYPLAQDQCGKDFLFFSSSSSEIIVNKIIKDSSCPTNRCDQGWICSSGPDGAYSCDCPPGYTGVHCENRLNFISGVLKF